MGDANNLNSAFFGLYATPKMHLEYLFEIQGYKLTEDTDGNSSVSSVSSVSFAESLERWY